MKNKRYAVVVWLLLAALLLPASDLLAQRGRVYRGAPRGHYYNYYSPRPYAYNRPSVSIQFGGIPYRYQYGYFYRPYGASFSLVMPPIGIRIGTLPPGYRRVMVGPSPYYYYNGTYYRGLPDQQYEVVAPPLGATVDALPPGARVTVIDGEKYYEYKGTYYREEITPDNELEYVVVGTDGVLNTLDDEEAGINEPEEDSVQAPAGPQMGDRFETLPAGAKAIVIRGEKLYASPSGLYYKEVIEGNKVYYEVVGK